MICNGPLYDVVIVGGGFSGTALTIHLLRTCRELSIAVIDPSSRAGGVAYGTHREELLLNVPARNMSLLPGHPSHFVDWLQQQFDFTIEPGAFYPRRLYGEYLRQSLAAEIARARNAQVVWVKGSATSIALRADKALVIVDEATSLLARMLVIATGNSPPSDPAPARNLTNRCYAGYAWSPDALAHIPARGHVLILGTGLNAVDQILSLRSQGFTGKIYLLSRRGKLPSTHQHTVAWDSQWAQSLLLTSRAVILVRLVRAELRRAAQEGAGWREVIDSLRPWTSQIWLNLPSGEKARLLRHVRPFWEVARHRLPEKISRTLDNLILDGQVRVLAGRLVRLEEHQDGVSAWYRPRCSDSDTHLWVDRVINCTGPANVMRTTDRLSDSLLRSGLASIDDTLLGPCIGTSGELIDGAKEPSSLLYTIGPVRKAVLWEVTAVPEIRLQAETLAALLVTKLEDIARGIEA